MQRIRVTILGAVWLSVGLAAGAAPNDWLESADWRRWLGTQEIGGRGGDFRTEQPREDQTGPTDTRRRLTAGALSLVLPGAGQFYNEDKSKALIMAGVEAVIWGTYLGFHHHAGTLADDYRNWAGIFAGTSGQHPDSYWQAVGRYSDSDAWYEALLRQARAFGEAAPPPPTASQEWQWRNQTYRVQYQELRADANSAYDRRDKMLLFAILNRAVSVYDAVRNGGRPSAATATSLLGLDLSLAVSPVFCEANVQASVGWGF